MEGTVGNSAVFGTFPEWAVESPVVLLHEAEARDPHALHASRRKDVRRRKLRCGWSRYTVCCVHPMHRAGPRQAASCLSLRGRQHSKY